MPNIVKIIFIIAAALYVAFIVALYLMQRQMIYHPDRDILPPSQCGLTNFNEYFIKTPDNETLQLWYHPARNGFPTIVYFHGNAGDMGDRTLIFANLSKRGFGLVGISYRGYGKSSGSPNEEGLYIDARTAIAFATQQQHLPINKIVLYGESLGTGVAVQMATEYNIAALILQAPYTSVAARAAEMYFYAPVILLIKDKYNSLEKIAKVKAPLLLFHGENDHVIPIAHAKILFAAANQPKKAEYFPGIKHNNFDTAILSEHVLDFCRTYKILPIKDN